MNDIRAPQIKAARALLDWSQEDLAANCNLSITTIRTMELGFIPKDTTLQKVRKAIDNAGVEITADGVRRRPEDLKTFRGPDSCDRLFESIAETASDYDGDILVVMVSEDVWLHPNGPTGETNLQRLEKLRDIAPIKCLLSDQIKLPSQSLAMQFQYLQDPSRCAVFSCTLIYGNKCALIQMISRTEFFIAELCVPVATLRHREKHLSLWEKASSLKTKQGLSKLKKRD
jgi:transcriptional regulator with XRE-family HTH domain